jgi:hypothetical protein
MSFNTFCGQDPANAATYNKLLLQFQEIETLDFETVNITDTNANANFFPVLTDAAGTGQRALFSDDGSFFAQPLFLNPATNVFQLGLVNAGVSIPPAAGGGVSIGNNFFTLNGQDLVGIGLGANNQSAGDFCVAIGDVANTNGGAFNNSTVLSATGNPLNAQGNSQLHISGLRGLATPALGGAFQLHYNPATSELFYSTTP